MEAKPKPEPTVTTTSLVVEAKRESEPTMTTADAAEQPGEDVPEHAETRCFMGHKLDKFYVADPGWSCSVCERTLDGDQVVFGCDLCNYDECEECNKLPRNDPLKEQRWKCSELKELARLNRIRSKLLRNLVDDNYELNDMLKRLSPQADPDISECLARRQLYVQDGGSQGDDWRNHHHGLARGADLPVPASG